MVPAVFVAAARRQETEDTWTLSLEPTDGAGPSIGPGQFMMVTAFGIGEVPISVSGPPRRPERVVLTVRSVGAVTRAICGTAPGGVLGLRGPFGNEWGVERADGDDLLIVAGGIGLAPLRPVVLAAIAERERFGSVSLLYGARTPDDLLYLNELEEWRRSIAVEVTVDTAVSPWPGRVGLVTKLIGDVVRPERTSAFVCGPEIMIRFVAQTLVERGLRPERIALSLERHMDCGVGLCGHCQLGPTLICRDGPVYTYAAAAPWLEVREL